MRRQDVPAELLEVEEEKEEENGETTGLQTSVIENGEVPPTLEARKRAEAKAEREQEELVDEYHAAIAALDLKPNAYTYNLHRVEPTHFKGRKCTGIMDSYKVHPELEDIAETHGGYGYRLVIKGPNPKTGRAGWTKEIPLPRINMPPKTGIGLEGAMPLDQIPVEGGKNELASVLGGVMNTFATMMKDSMKESRSDLKEVLQKIGAAPAVNQSDIEDRREREAQRQRDHDLMMKKMDKEIEDRKIAEKERREADERREKDRREAEERREKERSEEAKRQEAQRDRDHQKEMARIKAESDAKLAEAAAAREESKRQHTEMLAAIKEVSKRKEEADPQEVFMKNIQLYKELRDEDGGRSKEIESAAADAIAKLPDKLDNLATKYMGWKERAEGKKEQQKKTSMTPNSVAVIDATAETVDEAPPPKKAEKPDDPVFEWPSDDEDLLEVGKKLGRNIEAALNAKWPGQRIFTEVVKKFPEALLNVIRTAPTDEVIKRIEENVAEDSIMRMSAGRSMLRLIHGLMRREAKKSE